MTSTPPHVVLGGNGVAGRETVRALVDRGLRTSSVGRKPSTMHGARSITADLLIARDVHRALRDAEVAYLTAGLPYSTRIWQTQWPVIVRNTIDAAVENGTHLVYLDNVYAYGPVSGAMTESTPINPTSRKGEVRAAALRALEEAAARGLVVTIGRSADFYGPGATTSAFNTYALDRIARGKAGTWFFDADQPHSLTYTPDIGNALAVLGTTPQAHGRTWHLPTAPALTGHDYLELADGSGQRTKVMSLTSMRLGALFNANARETLEMAYQYTAPYLLDSTTFQSAFNVSPTSPAEGIKNSLSPGGG